MLGMFRWSDAKKRMIFFNGFQGAVVLEPRKANASDITAEIMLAAIAMQTVCKMPSAMAPKSAIFGGSRSSKINSQKFSMLMRNSKG